MLQIKTAKNALIVIQINLLSDTGIKIREVCTVQ